MFFRNQLLQAGTGDSFSTIQTDAGTSPVADSTADTLTLTSTDSSSIVITGTAGTDTVDFTLADPFTVESANATTQLLVNNTAADGDPILGFQLSGTSLFTIGVDDGDSDSFKIGTTAIGTNTRLVIDSTGNVGIGSTLPIFHTLQVDGHLGVIRTADGPSLHALEVRTDAAGFGDFNAILVAYTTGAIATGQDEACILLNIDQSITTGGAVVGFEVLSTTGSADVFGMQVGAVVNPVLQLSGTFGDMDFGERNGTDQLAAFLSTVTDIAIFEADNDTISVGDIAQFSEIEFLLDTVASGPGIKPTFEFSTGVGTWTTFTPTDGTNGFRQSGILAFEASDIPTWAVGESSMFIIRVTRTQNSLTTNPIENLIQITAVTEHKWDKDGLLTIAKVAIGTVTSPATILEVEDGASTTGIQISNTATDGDPFLSFALSGTAVFTMGVDDGDVDKFKIGTTAIGTSTRLTITSGGSVGIGTTSPLALLHISEDTADTSVLVSTFSDTASDNPKVILSHSRGTEASPTATQTGDVLGDIECGGWDTAFSTQLAIRFQAAAEWGTSSDTTDNPFSTLFATCPDGSAVAVERMQIDSDGLVRIGGALASSDGQLYVDQLSTSGAKPVLTLDQADIDDTFINYVGTSAADGTRSISSDTTEDGAKFGAFRVEINGVTKWVRVYDDHS